MPRFKFDKLKTLLPQQSPQEPPSLVIVGMGNPGPKYAKTRHNAGFWFIDKLAQKHGITLTRGHRTTHLGEGEIDGHRIILSKPRTHVNGTGDAVTYLLARFRIKAENLLIVYDEIALTPGVVRLRPQGSAAGHNGMKSIIAALGSQEFARLRIGVGRPYPGSDQIGYVLGRPSREDQEQIDEAVEKSLDAVSSLLDVGIDTTMNRFN
jgi:PTH1 family peptidyl-tRNA hydrolase